MNLSYGSQHGAWAACFSSRGLRSSQSSALDVFTFQETRCAQLSRLLFLFFPRADEQRSAGPSMVLAPKLCLAHMLTLKALSYRRKFSDSGSWDVHFEQASVWCVCVWV